MSNKGNEIEGKSKDSLESFASVGDKISLLIDSLESQDIDASFLKTRLKQITSDYQFAFEEAFKPTGSSKLSSQVVASSFFKQNKIENFTFRFLSNLIDSFQEKIHLAVSAYAENRSEKEQVITALSNFQKLLAVIADIFRGKLSSGTDFIDNFNRMLLTINDNSLLTKLITDYSLGSKDSDVQDFVNDPKNKLEIYIRNSIEALDNALKNPELSEKPSQRLKF